MQKLVANELLAVHNEQKVIATVSYSIIAEKDSRRLKIFSLKVELVSEESRVAIMNAIK